MKPLDTATRASVGQARNQLIVHPFTSPGNFRARSGNLISLQGADTALSEKCGDVDCPTQVTANIPNAIFATFYVHEREAYNIPQQNGLDHNV